MDIPSGCKPAWVNHNDIDFHKSFGTLTVDPNTLPKELDLDAGFWNPYQLEGGTFAPTGQPSITVAPQPYGCTNFTQTDLCSDEDNVLYNPWRLENATHANARQGISVIESINAAIKVFDRGRSYYVRAQGILDWFDAFRVCMASTASEKRSISIGTMFYPDWISPLGYKEILTVPAHILPPKGQQYTWHNWKICGWVIKGNQPMLKCKMWTGQWAYMPRATINAIMVNGTCAYTMSKKIPPTLQPIDITWSNWIVSLIRNLLQKKSP